MNGNVLKKGMIATILVAIVFISGFSAMSHGAVTPSQTGKGILYLGQPDDITNFNYFDVASNTNWKADVLAWSFESLFIQDFDGSTIPLLAQNYTLNLSNPNQPVVTVHIRQGVYFIYPINGTPAYELTAKDVVFSYFALRYGTLYSGALMTIPFDDNNDGVVEYNEMLHHVKFIDNWTVQFTMRQVYGNFFLMTMNVPIIPWKIWANHLKADGIPGDNQSTVVNPNGSTAGIIDTSWNSDPLATTGTGSYYYSGGVTGSYRIESLNTNYWGKNFITPAGYRIYPQNVTELFYKIYTTTDTTILALESGEIDYSLTGITPGYVATLSQDPQVTVYKSPSTWYYYLEFNEAMRPFNDINFRHAISYLLDKTTIVQSFLGGLGMAGDSPVPPYYTAWYNSSVVRYPFDVATASAILNASGYKIGPDGWRLMPDGTPMPQITIIAPPADYDPVRIKTADYLASEMRAIGINAQSKAIAVPTLVADEATYNYQMLILGGNGAPDPITHMADLFSINGFYNTCAFWPSNYTNPYYPNIKSLADNQTSAYALKFQNVMTKALTTFDVSSQIYYAKWAQGIITEAVPWNFLYYRVGISAFSNSWSGWIVWQGSVFNIFSLANLHKGAVSGIGSGTTTQQSVGPIIYPPTTEFLVSQIYGPSKVFVPQSQLNVPSSLTTVPVYVTVTDNNGIPVPDAYVNITSSNANVKLSSSSGITNSAGIFTVYVSGVSPGFSTLNAFVQYKSMNVTSKFVIQSVQYVPNILYMNAVASKPSLQGGQNTTISVTVTDEYGNPVPGANVSVAVNQLGYGSITPYYAITDSNGSAKFLFTAPSSTELATKYLNMHLQSKILLNVSKPGYSYSNLVTINLVTYNPNPSSWITTHIVGASKYFVNQTSLSTVITVQALNAQNNPVANISITATPSNSTYISGITPGITNSTGYANVTVTFKPGLKTTVISLKIWNTSNVYSAGSSISIGYLNGAPPSNMFAGYIDFYDGVTNATTNFVTIAGGNAGDRMVVHLFGPNNMPVSGSIPVGVVLTAAPEGSLLGFIDPAWTNASSYYFDTFWEYVGLNINTTYMGYLPPTSGVFISQLDNRVADPVLARWLGVTTNTTAFDYVYYGYGIYLNNSYVVNGTGTYKVISGDAGSPLVDRISNVYVVPYAYTYYPQTQGIYPPGVLVNGNFYMQGTEYIASQLVVQRAPDYRIALFTVNNPYGFAGGKISVTATLYNSNDQPVPNTKVWFYSKFGASPARISATTNANGTATGQVSLIKTTGVGVYDLFVYWNKGSNAWGISSIPESSQIVIVPYQANVFAAASATSVVYGSSVQVAARVVDANGNPIPGITISGTGSTGLVTGPTKTDSSGNAVFTVIPTTGIVTGTPYVIDTVSIKATGPVYSGGVYTVTIIAYSTSPTITVTSLIPNQIVTTSSYYVNGTVWDPSGIKSVTLYLNNPANSFSVTLTNGTNGQRMFSESLTGFYSGLNAVFVSVTNNNNVTTVLPVFFYYQPVTYVSSGYFNSTLSGKLGSLSSQLNHTLAGYFGSTMGYVALVLEIIAFIVAIVALALSMRKPKQPEVKQTPEEKKEGAEPPK
ncbi:MAG: ABC transporter substrate-binding protein [Thermoplasmata archaeon]